MLALPILKSLYVEITEDNNRMGRRRVENNVVDIIESDFENEGTLKLWTSEQFTKLQQKHFVSVTQAARSPIFRQKFVMTECSNILNYCVNINIVRGIYCRD